MIVVDVGCANHGVPSLDPLLERFDPGAYYGFDPHAEDRVYTQGNSLVQISHEAAWTYNGKVRFQAEGSASRIDRFETEVLVDCFDFGEWLEPLLAHDVVVKLDCEGSEFALIDVMRKRAQLERLHLLLVEWHIPCAVEEWDL